MFTRGNSRKDKEPGQGGMMHQQFREEPSDDDNDSEEEGSG